MKKNDVLNTQLGSIIRGERQRRGLSAAEVAQTLGITTKAYLRYENGDRTVGPHTLARIADKFGRRGGDLLNDAIEAETTRKDPFEAYGIDGPRLVELADQQRTESPLILDIAHFSQTLTGALELIEALHAGDLAYSKPMLALSVTAEFTHALRYLVLSDPQIESIRPSVLSSLLKIYEGARGTDLTDRAAREQAAYFLSLSQEPNARHFMEGACRSEQDLWVKRAIIRGLAKGVLPEGIAEHHEKELAEPSEMQKVDLGYWRYYSGDEHDLGAALSRDPPDKGYHNTLNAVLYNLLSGAERKDRRFDLRTAAAVIERVNPRSISKAQRQLLARVMVDQPREPRARPAWEDFKGVAGAKLDLPRTTTWGLGAFSPSEADRA